MSRVGKRPVDLPAGVEADLQDGVVTLKGEKGRLECRLSPCVRVTLDGQALVVAPVDHSKQSRAHWGMVRSRLNSAVEGVSRGFSKTLEIRGVGYRAALKGNILSLSLGYSHEIKYVIPDGLEVQVEKQTTVIIKGIDKQLVGQVASEIRALRKPEPYKGKGVRYSGEYVRMKEGKKK